MTNDQRLAPNDRPSQLPKQKRINIRQLFNLRGGVVFEPSPVKRKRRDTPGVPNCLTAAKFLPGTDTKNRTGRNAQAILRASSHDIGHPRVRVLQFENAPREWPVDHKIYTAARRDTGSVI